MKKHEALSYLFPCLIYFGASGRFQCEMIWIR